MKALVTGGGGFLGRRIVELLLAEGHDVRFIARQRYPQVEALGAHGLQVDLLDTGRLREALDGVDVVFHAAGKTGFWGSREEYVAVNVEGTSNLLEAARAAGVRKLVFTSTPSVVGYDGDARGISEAPYATVHLSFYPYSKAIAEQRVLAANGPTLATVALRPHLIFGPGDRHLLPRVVRNAHAGRMVMVGDGSNVVDMTYVDNAAWAHLDAERALIDHSVACAGRAYFISNGEPVRLWQWMGDFLPRVGAPHVSRRMSLRAATRLGAVMEWSWRTFSLAGEPRMTRFLASALARSHWYDMAPAARDLGYRVRIPMDEAADRTVAWFLKRDREGTDESVSRIVCRP
jgi:nucleoside-diphosphate-sugar epimerase